MLLWTACAQHKVFTASHRVSNTYGIRNTYSSLLAQQCSGQSLEVLAAKLISLSDLALPSLRC